MWRLPMEGLTWFVVVGTEVVISTPILKNAMKRILSALIAAQTLFFAIVTARAVPLAIVNVGAPAINCVFDPTCTNLVADTSGTIRLSGTTGAGFLQSRTFTCQSGAAAAGRYASDYRTAFT